MPRRDAGFTLIELAVALFVIALLLGSILVPLATQVEQRQASETQKTMDEIREALIGHALANGYLPCPDSMSGTGVLNDGAEDVTAAGACQNLSGTVAYGNLPWATLGLGTKDVWGNRFRYMVMGTFAQRPISPSLTPLTFSLTTPATLQVCENTTCALALSSVAVAVIVSHGSNGYGAMNASTNSENPAPLANSDELENTDGNLATVKNLKTVSRTKSNIAGSEFDDIVTSLSKYTLLNRMVAAGKLP